MIGTGKMKTIAVTSGKGGTGKTCVTANLGATLAAMGRRVVLFDADLQLANLDVALGIKAQYGLQHVLTEEKTLREILCQGPGGVQVATGGSAIPALMSAGPKRMGKFISQLEDLESDTDYLLFDTGAGLDNRVMTFLGLAQLTVLVTTPDPTSVTDAYATVKVATRRAPETEFGLVVNMVGNPAEGLAVHSVLDKICRTFLDRGLPYLGSIHQDKDVAAATRRRQVIAVTASASQPAHDIRDIAVAIHKRRTGNPVSKAA